jgi:Predicted membrane protein (DUF2339).
MPPPVSEIQPCSQPFGELTMDDQISRLESTVEELSHAVRAMDVRLARLEGAPAQVETGNAAPPPLEAAVVEHAPAEKAVAAASSQETDDADETENVVQTDLTLIGRTLIVLAGAYLLRAVTEAHFLPLYGGIALGLAYALFWIVIADRTKPGDPVLSPTLHGVAAAMIAYPLLLEATTRFEVFTNGVASVILTIVTSIFLGVAWRRDLHALAWVVSLLAIGATFGMIAKTAIVVPFTCFLLFLGIATVWIGYASSSYDRKWLLLRWPTAGAVNLMSAILVLLVIGEKTTHTPLSVITLVMALFIAYVASFAARTIVRSRDVTMFEILQSLSVLIIGFGGSVWIASATSLGRVPLGITSVVFGAAAYATAFAFVQQRGGSNRNFLFYSSFALVMTLIGSAILAGGEVAALLWAAFGAITAWLAWRYAHPLLEAHSAAYIVAGAVSSGLIAFGAFAIFYPIGDPKPALSAGAMAVIASSLFAFAAPLDDKLQKNLAFRIPRTISTILFVWGFGGAVIMILLAALHLGAGSIDPAVVATIRTAVLSAAAIGLALACRWNRFADTRMLVYPLLTMVALKLLIEDFRVGRPVTLFITFALYGGALIAAPRLRRRRHLHLQKGTP